VWCRAAYAAFPDYLASGATWPRSAHDPWLLEALRNATKPDAAVIAEVVLPQAPGLPARLERGGVILDVGAGAGFALVAYATRFPTARLVGLELDPPSAALARKAVADAGLSDRIELRELDALLLEDRDAYDLVTCNIVLHETGGPPQHLEVLRRLHRALKPGGVLVVSELPYPDSPAAYRDQPVYRMLAGSSCTRRWSAARRSPRASSPPCSPRPGSPRSAWSTSPCPPASRCWPPDPNLTTPLGPARATVGRSRRLRLTTAKSAVAARARRPPP
jgi:SAM-dependent methyltransferase